MRSRILIGSGAWIIGVLTATGGSLYVSQQLGQGIFSSNSALTSSQVQTKLSTEAGEGAPPSTGPSGSTSPSGSASGSRSGSPSSSQSSSPSGSKSSPGSGSPGSGGGSTPPPAPSSSPTPVGALFQTSQGSAYADCRPGGAYLEYWSAQSGYDAENVVRGPAATASVTFRVIGGDSGVVLNISCVNGTPQMSQQAIHGGD